MFRLLHTSRLLTLFVGVVAGVTASAITLGAGPNVESDYHVRWAQRAFSEAPAALPFSFLYGGQHSSELIGKWNHTVTEEPVDAGKLRRTLTLTDPETGLEVRVVATVYLDTPGVEWTLYFTNKGQKDTPILEQIKAVDATVKSGVSGGGKLLRLVGSPCRVDDWLPLEDACGRASRSALLPSAAARPAAPARSSTCNGPAAE